METKILLIEDDQIDQRAFERFVEREMPTCQYQVAGSVARAKTLLLEDTFDMIIMDYFLGDGDAFDIMTLIEEIPVIFVSGAGDEEVVIEAMRSGACDFLIKDVSRNYLKVLPLTVEKIMAQKKAKEKLRQAEMQVRKLSHVSKQTVNPVIIFDVNKNIEWVNEAYLKLTGYSIEEIKGISAGLMQRGEDPFENPEVLQHLEMGNSYEYESLCYTKNGDTYWSHNSLTPISDPSGKSRDFVIVQTNITEKKKTELALIQAKEAALDSEKAKEHFLANMSHEIRTPMNSIVGFTDLLLQDNTLSPQQLEYLDAIRWSSENLLGVINDILDFSKIESGKVELESTPINIRKLADSCIKSFVGNQIKEGVSLKVDVDVAVPNLLLGDPVRINQILTNLVSNGLKFTEHGEVRLEILETEREYGQHHIKFVVSDTGIGIPSQKLSSIFETFTQASSDTTRKYGGTGLGLPIVKKLVELQGGQIKVESQEGNGSRFEFTLLLAKAEESAEKETDKTSFNGIDSVKLLVVEDHPLNQLLIKASLNGQNLAFDLACNGKEAIDKLNEEDYDLILMDIHMPEMGGIKATQIIRNVFSEPKRSIPIIAMTASAIRSDLEACLKTGMNDYIPKPFKAEELFSKIIKWVKSTDDIAQNVA